MKDINKDANIRLAINHIDEAIGVLFQIHDHYTLEVIDDLERSLFKLRELRKAS